MSLPTWRLIPPLQTSGQLHMTIDRWLLEQHRSGQSPPILRFYTWSPVAISLGYHQRHYPEFWHQLTWQGEPIEIVQRPSGGRAVLHQGDLTYAVITSGLAGRRMQAYQTICQFLIEGGRRLGLELQYGSAGRGYIQHANCFGTSTIADLVLPDGTKLIGSAQLRRDQAILQHGSIRFDPNPTLFTQVFGSAPSLSWPAVFPLPHSVATMIETLTAAARDCFQVEFICQPFTTAEWQAIQTFSACTIAKS